MRDYNNEYKKQVAQHLDVDNVFLFWKARVGLYAILKAMGISRGDEVILPAYTCVVVPNAVIYLGAKPVYIDISAKTYNMDLEKIHQSITRRTKAIICQNTYGLSTDLEELSRIAKHNQLFTIEDCTHGFGGTYNGIKNGLHCDAAIYSTQWNKPFSTGIGGFAITRNAYIEDQLTQINQSLTMPSSTELANLQTLYLIKKYLLNKLTYWPLVKFYRWLSNRNLVVGSSSGQEISTVKMPEGYFKSFSNLQAKQGLKALSMLQQNIKKRKETAAVYTDYLIQKGKNHVPKNLFPNHSFLKYPLLVNNREQFFEQAVQNKIELGDWFTSPLHPVGGDLSAWSFDPSNFPVASFTAAHIINLPTTPSDINRVLSFLDQQTDTIIDQA